MKERSKCGSKGVCWGGPAGLEFCTFAIIKGQAGFHLCLAALTNVHNSVCFCDSKQQELFQRSGFFFGEQKVQHGMLVTDTDIFSPLFLNMLWVRSFCKKSAQTAMEDKSLGSNKGC